MTLYAKWTAGAQSDRSQQSVSQTGSATAPQTAKATPAATQAQSTSAATAASGTSSTMTQTPAPVLGVLLGLLAAVVLLRRKKTNPLPLFFSHAGGTPDRRHKAFPQKKEHGTLPVQLTKTNR